MISPQKNGRTTKRLFVLQNIQGLNSQVQNVDTFDCNKHRYIQTRDFSHQRALKISRHESLQPLNDGSSFPCCGNCRQFIKYRVNYAVQKH